MIEQAAVGQPSRDPTEPLRLQASRFPDVDEGTACTQSSFKTGGKAFLFVGMQGGRYKTMFKLEASLDAASDLQEREPDRIAVGKHGWVTARFTAQEPLPTPLWTSWLAESYALAGGGRAPSGATRLRKKA